MDVLNKGKSPDIFGITIEHLLNADEVILEFLLHIYNTMLNNGEVPNAIKKGLLSPVFKKKGSKKLANYYRGITVLPVLNKILENIIKLRIQPQIMKMQNPCQRGFIANTSPLNASFIIEELKRNAKDEKTPVIIVLLDAKLAFHVVDPYHLLRRLYQTGINDKLWSLINSLHQGATSVVK